MTSAKRIIEATVSQAVNDAVRNSPNASQSAAHPIAREVMEAVVPIALHNTNNEQWWKSRVTWGAIASIALPMLGALGVSSDVIDADQFTSLGIALGTAAGGVLTLYGRWKARKPIGD